MSRNPFGHAAVVVAGVLVGWCAVPALVWADCWVCTPTGPHSSCGNCVSSDCPSCEQGVCLGNEKVCAPNFSCARLHQAGYLTLNYVTYNCFCARGCAPTSGSNCNPPSVDCAGNPNADWACSSTTFQVPIGDGTCTITLP